MRLAACLVLASIRFAALSEGAPGKEGVSGIQGFRVWGFRAEGLVGDHGPIMV